MWRLRLSSQLIEATARRLLAFRPRSRAKEPRRNKGVTARSAVGSTVGTERTPVWPGSSRMCDSRRPTFGLISGWLDREMPGRCCPIWSGLGGVRRHARVKGRWAATLWATDRRHLRMVDLSFRSSHFVLYGVMLALCTPNSSVLHSVARNHIAANHIAANSGTNSGTSSGTGARPPRRGLR